MAGPSSLRVWLFTVLAVLFALVTIGGVTRITGSGLSITEWKPITGVVPPLSDAQWEAEFEKYRAIPQFSVVNPTMDLAGFKSIYFWEFLHRLAARLVGLVFALPFFYFLARGRIPQSLRGKLWGALALGGFQGFLGWFMVSSGLKDLTYVSHYRLAVHLIVAFVIACLVLSAWEDLRPGPRPAFRARVAPWLFAGIALQSVFGAFTAGLKAGYQYPTFPHFHGSYFPTELLPLSLSNPVLVQWVHRALATVLVCALMGYWLARKEQWKRLPDRTPYRVFTAIAHIAVIQFIVGVGVVLHGVPVGLGALHQALGAALFVLSFYFMKLGSKKALARLT